MLHCSRQGWQLVEYTGDEFIELCRGAAIEDCRAVKNVAKIPSNGPELYFSDFEGSYILRAENNLFFLDFMNPVPELTKYGVSKITGDYVLDALDTKDTLADWVSSPHN